MKINSNKTEKPLKGKLRMIKRLFIIIFNFCALVVLFSFAINTNNSNNQRQSLKTIVIDAGHGLPNRNAEGIYSYESELTLAIALKLGQRLKEVLPECNILYTRGDEYLPGGLTDQKKQTVTALNLLMRIMGTFLYLFMLILSKPGTKEK